MNNKVINPGTTTERESFRELLGQFAKNLAAVVHDEIQLVIQRLRDMVKTALGGVLLIVAGTVISIPALMCFATASIIGLTSYMSLVIAALATGVAFALVGIVIAFVGYRQLKK